MDDYFWFLIIFIGLPCVCFTIYKVVERICEYKEKMAYAKRKE